MAKNLLENWRVYKKLYNDLFISIHFIIENTTQLKRADSAVNKLYNKISSEDVSVVDKGAKQEIENLLFTNNNNSDRLIRSIKSDLSELNELFQKIKSMHQKKYRKEFKEDGSFLISVLFPSFQYWFQELTKIGDLNKSKDNYTNRIWFKVGLLFATGEMDKLLKKNNNNYHAVARALGKQSYRPYISETQSDTNKSDKNIYSNPAKVKKIYDYCLMNNKTVTAAFKSKLQQD